MALEQVAKYILLSSQYEGELLLVLLPSSIEKITLAIAMHSF